VIISFSRMTLVHVDRSLSCVHTVMRRSDPSSRVVSSIRAGHRV